ncbi:MAG TPA: SH3 domain-containing protein [Novosphingobium sp.]|nr:SH3 domain-containing protein [Novosphingobium sp.]
MAALDSQISATPADTTLPLEGSSFALAGPSARLDPRRSPVRGDLAHVRMAGRVFVPHYVVPMPRRVAAQGADLLSSPGAEAIAAIPAGATFHVLDMAGGYAWGEFAEGEVPGGEIAEGAVGYIALDRLENVA